VKGDIRMFMVIDEIDKDMVGENITIHALLLK